MKLKLVHLKTYIMNGHDTPVKKGEIVHVTDSVGKMLLNGGRHNADNERICYWDQVSDDAKVDFDFRPAEDKAKTAKDDEPAKVAESTQAPAETQVAPPVQRSQRSRARAAA